MIRSSSVSVGDSSTVPADVDIVAPGGFTIGKCCYIGHGVKIHCWKFEAGDYLYIEDEAEIGRGGCFSSEQSSVVMGNAVFLGSKAVINPNCLVTIGDETGIGSNVGIWTHGAYPSVLDGFPARFAPVTLGRRVWLTGQSQVLPGVTIGDNVVISMLSLVNKDLPAGCLAGGIPVQVLRDNVYPAVVDRAALLDGIMGEYLKSASWRSLDLHALDERKFNFDDLSINGGVGLTDVEEDYRDFLRRRGIRFLTGKPFKSIPHPLLVKCR